MITDVAEKTPVKEKRDGRSVIQLPPGGVALTEVERELVRQAMEHADGNQTHAAELLGIERDALRRRLVKYGFLHPHAGSIAEASPPKTARPTRISMNSLQPMKWQHGLEQSET